VENNTSFGLKAIIRNGLTLSLFLKDISIPFIIGIGVAVFLYVSDGDILLCLRYVLELALSVIPSIVGLSLAAYTIVNAFVLGSQAEELKTKEGIEFLTKLNSSFAICLIISLSSLMLSVICRLIDICNVCIDVKWADFINAIVLSLLITSLIYSIWCLFWIVIDIFNVGQTRTINGKEEVKNDTAEVN
jgi:hypothetical protein